ncbi:helix-turn-helix transcriptional regulator [Sphingomonas sp. HF-S4]|uniref:Helix-turn-helix transcriptional regulator n=1 Tax=Sphingomonas agrestis TaxID=3080540 RepID=A0ABU3Y3A7_9SPHN|nr:helix-turn-helix transcriptional regulator [Sphingomonas sp. HF-S4]MDV3455844.1 helix-turn-helix transcriptional regulator [Sphingomonas sp. HF-S4]
MIWIDRQRIVVGRNAAAEEILEKADPLELAFGRLHARCRHDLAKLETAMTQAQAGGYATAVLGEAGLGVEVVRGAPNAVEQCVVLLRDPSKQRAAKIVDVARQFGLTKAEQRLLEILIQGASLPDAARMLGVARSTTRTHLQRLFDKTGKRRQVDLLRMITTP